MEALLTTQEVADFLRIPVRTLYDWRLRGLGPRATRVGRHLRFREADVRAWLDENSVEPRNA